MVEEKDIPKLKAALCRKLHDVGKTQDEISLLLNITQPMVSKYLSKKEFPLFVERLADRIAETIQGGKGIKVCCAVCDNEISHGEYFVCTSEHLLSNEKSSVISNIGMAVSKLRERNLSAVVPNVKMNIAMAIKGAKSEKDIGSVPGGLVIVNGKVKGYNEPEFGVSRHLSDILLYAMSISDDAASVIDIKYSDDIRQRLRKARLRHYFLDGDYEIESKKKSFDALVHKGSFGIEPCCYVFGKNAVDAAEKCLRLV